MLLAINGKEVAGAFCLKEKTNQKEFRMEKVIKKKDGNSLSNGRVMIIHSIAGLKTKIYYRDESIFSWLVRAFPKECEI